MAKSISFEKDGIRRKFIEYGLSEESIVELMKTFDKNNRRMDIILFVMFLERSGMKRKRITELMQEFGIDDSTIINIFIAVDKKRQEYAGKELTQIVLED